MKKGIRGAVLVIFWVIGGAATGQASNEVYDPESERMVKRADAKAEAKVKSRRPPSARIGRGQPAVDINSATPKMMQARLGVSLEAAKKIADNRPYGSRAWLVTKSIVSPLEYERIRHKVIAKQNTGSVGHEYRSQSGPKLPAEPK